jgi:ABC-2 family transporter protein
MLRKLIRKDLLLTRKRLLLNAGLLLVFVIFLLHWGDIPVGLFAGALALMFSFSPVTVVAHEDKSRAVALGCSLPVRRRDIVRARYLLGLGLGVVGLAGAWLLALAWPWSPYNAAALLAPATLLTALGVLVVSMALFLPLAIRFGFVGIMIVLVGLQVLGVSDLFLANRFGIAHDTTLSLDWLHSLLGDAGFFVTAFAALAVLLAASLQVSTSLFERQDL